MLEKVFGFLLALLEWEKFLACEKALIFIVFMRYLHDEEKVPCYKIFRRKPRGLPLG